MSWITRNPGLVRARPIESLRPWRPGIAVSTLAEIHWECLCTWVLVDGVFVMKFSNSLCPVLAHTR